ncbi:MAG: hypothetical protein GY801_02350 [bacterium]|nr:hypothetical protein [bacterium]
MAELETLITLLASQFGEHLILRDALIETTLIVMAEERQETPHRAPQASYPQLLDRIARQQQQQQEQTERHELHAALQELSLQIREDLQHAALALHQSLRAGNFQHDGALVQRVGIELNEFPVGFPQEISLLKISKAYLDAVTDLTFLQQHFPQKVPQLIGSIEQEKLRAASHLQALALEILFSARLKDSDLIRIRKRASVLLGQQHIDAENELLTILEQHIDFLILESVSKLDSWLQKYHFSALTVLKSLSSSKQAILQELLIRSHNYLGLEALIRLGPPHKKEQERFKSFMTLRFGDLFLQAQDSWKNRLQRQIDTATQKTQALSFWQVHLAVLPQLLAEHIPALSPEKDEFLKHASPENFEESNLETLLERRQTVLTAQEKQLLSEGVPQFETAPEAAQPTKFSFDEQELEDTLSAPDREENIPQESALPTLLDGAMESVVEAAIEGDLLESALITAIDKGTGAFDDSLTVSVEDDDTQEEFAPAGAISLKAERRKKSKVLPQETEKNIWQDHIFPFIRANLVFVLAPSLIFVGLLLLVFTLWDKAPWIRYGLTPFMIVSVSYALSRIGLWLKGEEIQSESPIAIMQGVAIFLAPMSLLFVALLAGDHSLTSGIRLVWGLALSVALLAAWWYIFVLSVNSVYRNSADIHSRTLLLLNALLLLLPIAQFMQKPGDISLNDGGKTILVAGFYTGFLILFRSMRHMLDKMLQGGGSAQRISMQRISMQRISMFFYSITCLGTFALVWGLTHARLALLPQPSTYGPLLLLFSFLLSIMEFKLLAFREQKGRISSLSYSAYFAIGLGVLLSAGHDYVRVLALLLAGLVWFYQAVKLQDERHYNISMVILTTAFSIVALVRGFPPPFFPYLTLAVIAVLYIISLSVPYKEVAVLAARLTPIYMSFAFVLSVLWQWAGEFPPLSYGFAFMVFGIFSIYLGAKTDRLIHVHAGAGYLVAALPYLGSVDMNLYTLQGNTLVFGLAMVGIFWTMMSSATQNAAIRDSRSTVLWNIGILAFCLMCLRVILGETLDFSSNAFLQFQILSGPLLIAALMVFAAYFTRSYVPVYLALVIAVIIFPEIKDRFDIPMYSGLGSSLSGLGFLLLVFLLSRFQRHPRPLSYKERGAKEDRVQFDLIWRKRSFPFQAENHYLLFANPLVVAAFFLFSRTIFVTYPLNYFRPLQPFGLKTCLAVLICGSAYHLFSLWFRKPWFSYIGFLAIGFGIVQSCYLNTGEYFYDIFLPIFLLIAILYSQLISGLSRRFLQPKQSRFISTPFTQLLSLVLWASALGLYGYYSFIHVYMYQTTHALFWAPLLAYLCALAALLGWKSSAKTSWFFLIPAYLLLWQFIILGITKGSYLPYVLIEPKTPFLLATSLLVLGLTVCFFLVELLLPKKKFRSLSPILWFSLGLLGFFSLALNAVFYALPIELPNLFLQLTIWAAVSLILGRYLNLGLLWLWSLFLLFPLLFSNLTAYARSYYLLAPLTLALAAIASAGLSQLTQRVKWLYNHRYSWPWAHFGILSPPRLFSLISQILVLLTFVQVAASTRYWQDWNTILALFSAALPALLITHRSRASRRLLFFVPYFTAWIGFMLLLPHHFPGSAWLMQLEIPHLIACGLLAGLLTAVLTDLLITCRDSVYRALKHVSAATILLLLLYSYFSLRNVDSLAWQRLLTSGILALWAGLYFRLTHPHGLLSSQERRPGGELNGTGLRYALFATGLTLSMLCGEILLLKYLIGMSLTRGVLFSIFLLPPLFFYARSEYKRATGRRYAGARNAALVLSLFLLAFYAFPPLPRFLALPSYMSIPAHYFQYAPLALLIGLLLFRLHALGGRAELLFIGMFTIVTSAFFLSTRVAFFLLGEISPGSWGDSLEFFTWIALALSYIFLLGTATRGFLKKALVRLGDIPETRWTPLRIMLFALCLGATHFVFLLSLVDPAGRPLIGIIFLLLAGLWVYSGYAYRNILFYSLAYSEIVPAIFSCRLFDAFWSDAWILWLLLALFGALIPLYSLFLKERYPHAAGSFYLWLSVTAGLIFYEHISFYGLTSRLGILPLLLLWILTLFVPVRLSARKHGVFQSFLGLLLYTPAFLFFVQQGPPSLQNLPRTLLSTMIISGLIIAYRIYEWKWLEADRDAAEPCVANHFHWFLTQTHSLLSVFLISTLAVIVVHVLKFYGGPELFARQFWAMLLVQAALTVYWFDLARRDRNWLWTAIGECMIAGAIFTLRQDLPQMLNLPWNVHWDLMMSLAIAFTIAVIRPFLKGQDNAIRLPIRFTLFGLPIVTLLYAFDFHVGFAWLSRVILLYSILFIWQAYSEKDRVVLAYAFLGINSYLIVILLHNQIHSPQAYITPVCISILILVQVFRDISSKTTANFVRGFTLFVLLGMSLLEAIVQNADSPTAHFIVIGLSILSVLAAIFLHIRIFASAGLFCFLLDLIAIIYIVLSRQNTETLKVILGLGFTVGGGLILSGYIIYRKNKVRIEDCIDSLKERFALWE